MSDRGSSAGEAYLVPRERAGTRVLAAEGDWVAAACQSIHAEIRLLADRRVEARALDMSGVARFDTAGALMLVNASRMLGGDAALPIQGADESRQKLIDVVSANIEGSAREDLRRQSPFLAAIARLGRAIDSGVSSTVEMVAFAGLMLSIFGSTAQRKRRFRLVPLVHHVEAAGLDAVPIIALITFLIGAVIASMSADILRDYGGEIFSVDLIAFAFLREFGVLLSAIMVAGRSGSAFTAEIGAMKGNEELDAMRALGLDPVELLVMPRVAALMISLPLLTFIADMMGLLGGMLVCWAALGLGPPSFTSRLLEVTSIQHFWVGMIKAPFFAFLIAMIGCYQGFKVTGSAESVGQRTTLSVVQAIFAVIVVDALFAMFYLEIGY